MTPRRRRWLIFRLVYLLLLLIGAGVVWWLIPAEVWTAIRTTYVNPEL